LGKILLLFICLLPYWLVFFQVHSPWNHETYFVVIYIVISVFC
jgi:hypothetical protein